VGKTGVKSRLNFKFLVMKEIFVISLLIFSLNIFSQFEEEVNLMNWLPEQQISSYPNEDSRYARMVIDSANTLHLVYCDDIPYLSPYGQKIIYKQKTENGSWSEGMIVCDFDGTDVNNQYPDIAVAENGDIHIVFRHTVVGEPEYIAHSFYNAQTGIWSQENISDVNTIDLFPYPKISTTFDNRPIACWEDDILDGTNSNAYFSYFNDTIWSPPILLGRNDDKKSYLTQIISLENHTSMICFAEVSTDGNYDELYYQIFNEDSNTLSEIKIIPTVNIPQNTYLFNYALARSKTDNFLILAYNLNDTIYTLKYDIAEDEFLQTNHTISTNGGAYILQKILDITCDNNGLFHIPFAQNNVNGLYYVNYDVNFGFGSIETINNFTNIDKPSIVCDNNNNLHLIYCDDRNDTNEDNYIDREVYYTSLDLSTKINKNNNIAYLRIYPNPAKEFFILESENKINKIDIFDITGKFVKTVKIDDLISKIDISDLNHAVYFVKIIVNGNYYFRKIIKN